MQHTGGIIAILFIEMVLSKVYHCIFLVIEHYLPLVLSHLIMSNQVFAEVQFAGHKIDDGGDFGGNSKKWLLINQPYTFIRYTT
ncbi:MAG: hypothetical protein NT010_06370 [Proteobacteria bacterium]|nr:hypothetical protein [Pseudomonadota bacterium]